MEVRGVSDRESQISISLITQDFCKCHHIHQALKFAETPICHQAQISKDMRNLTSNFQQIRLSRIAPDLALANKDENPQ